MHASEPLPTHLSRARICTAWVCALSCLLAAPAALGQQANSREQEQLRRLRQQLQQLQEEQTTTQQAAQQAAQKLAAERSAMADQLKAAQAAAGQVQASAAARGRALVALQAEMATLKTERDALQAELGRGKEAQTETLGRLERSSTELNGTRARLLSSETAYTNLRRERGVLGEQLDKCSASNTELVRVGQELLGRYGNFGLGETMAGREPFLQFKRVQLENLAQDYRSRIDEQRYTPPPQPQPSAAARQVSQQGSGP
jgi:chromosome segregation ATPase